MEEMLDILNEDGTPAGRIVSRKEAHREGILHGTSQIFIYRVKNGKVQILLQRRSLEKDSFPGKLDISSAGHIPSGVSPDDNAVKELEEELGLSVKKQQLHFVFIHRSEGINTFHGKVFNDRQVSYVYVLECDKEEDEFILQKSELSQVIWQDADITIDEIIKGNGEYCLDRWKFEKVTEIIKDMVDGSHTLNK